VEHANWFSWVEEFFLSFDGKDINVLGWDDTKAGRHGS
jgi:hypothetical protein